MCNLIGRNSEIAQLNNLYNSNKSQFVAIYGRRRVGKTFLVDEALRGKITFRHAGLSPVDESGKFNMLKDQLRHFYHSLLLHGMKKHKCPATWQEAFFMLEQYLRSIDDGSRQVVFIDELPWMDTARSGFVTALEGYWNSWACHRSNLMLVVCGSATSWMQDNLINNHGGLYGRITYEIKLAPFTLAECEAFFNFAHVKFSRYDIVQSYMMVGGIPFYLGYFDCTLSLSQNINKLFFEKNARLRGEYDRLFSSVFSNPDEMKRIIEMLSTRRSGYTRAELVSALKLKQGGAVTKALNSLIASDFIVKYVPFGDKARSARYKLVDSFCLFYLRYVKGNTELNPEFWIHNELTQSVISWRGFAFEELCLNHIKQIKAALGIAGVMSTQSAWSLKGSDEIEGSQIDLLINRADNVVNMCEMKFYNDDFTVTKSYDRTLVRRENALAQQIKRRTTIHPTLITTYGLKRNEYSGNFVSVVTMDDLFKE